jgi:hypothetical protein
MSKENKSLTSLPPPVLNNMLGETKQEQEQKVLDRLKRKKALMKARQEQGLSTEDAVLETILDQQDEEQGEEEKKKRVSRP